jgi:excisionase family DNA binding protein
MAEQQEKLILTVDELAPMLGVGVSVIYRMVKAKKIPYRKLGRTTVFSLDSIKDWLKEGDGK